MQAIKNVIRRFNTEVIVGGNRATFEALMDPDFVNRSAPPGAPNDAESLWNTFQHLLRPAFAEMAVTIHDQIAEDDKVTTRKTISAIHTGPIMGIAPTGLPVAIEVIDIVRIAHGRYVEHWGVNTLPAVLAQLRAG